VLWLTPSKLLRQLKIISRFSVHPLFRTVGRSGKNNVYLISDIALNLGILASKMGEIRIFARFFMKK
jgi:hypothetical protein